MWGWGEKKIKESERKESIREIESEGKGRLQDTRVFGNRLKPEQRWDEREKEEEINIRISCIIFYNMWQTAVSKGGPQERGRENDWRKEGEWVIA